MFVQRYNDGDEQVVVLRYVAAYYWLMWPTVMLTILAWLRSSVALNVAAGVAVVLLLVSAAPYWPVLFQLKRQMRESSITASGSKYSFSHPLTYRWVAAGQGSSDA